MNVFLDAGGNKPVNRLTLVGAPANISGGNVIGNIFEQINAGTAKLRNELRGRRIGIALGIRSELIGRSNEPWPASQSSGRGNPCWRFLMPSGNIINKTRTKRLSSSKSGIHRRRNIMIEANWRPGRNSVALS